MTTVGYGDVYPTTAEGRIAASALMLLGIGLFSAVTAIITSFLVTSRSTVPDPIAAIERLGALAKAGLLTQAEFDSKRADLLERI
jgi:voltage-gated potassium channel